MPCEAAPAAAALAAAAEAEAPLSLLLWLLRFLRQDALCFASLGGTGPFIELLAWPPFGVQSERWLRELAVRLALVRAAPA